MIIERERRVGSGREGGCVEQRAGDTGHITK